MYQENSYTSNNPNTVRAAKPTVTHRNKNSKSYCRKARFNYAILDPFTGELIRTFDHIKQLEDYSGLKSISGRISNYCQFKLNPTDTPTIAGVVVIRYKARSTEKMSREDYLELIHKLARPHLIRCQLFRLYTNLASIDESALDKLYYYIKKLEQIK